MKVNELYVALKELVDSGLGNGDVYVCYLYDENRVVAHCDDTYYDIYDLTIADNNQDMVEEGSYIINIKDYNYDQYVRE